MRRGLALPEIDSLLREGVVAGLRDRAARATLVPSLVRLTARAASRLAAARPMTGVVPARLAEVSAGVIIAMCRTRCVAAALLAAIGILAGSGAWAWQSVRQGREDRRSSVVAPSSSGAREAPTILIA
jgi:hypothetical protein